jgi:hypothetical protein
MGECCSDDVGCLIMGYYFGKMFFFITCLFGYTIGDYGAGSYDSLVMLASIGLGMNF